MQLRALGPRFASNSIVHFTVYCIEYTTRNIIIVVIININYYEAGRVTVHVIYPMSETSSVSTLKKLDVRRIHDTIFSEARWTCEREKFETISCERLPTTKTLKLGPSERNTVRPGNEKTPWICHKGMNIARHRRGRKDPNKFKATEHCRRRT